MATHECPGGCGSRVISVQLACRSCWFRLPKELRDEVNASYRSRTRDRMRHASAILQAGRWYRANPA